jgi:hypothetical protein
MLSFGVFSSRMSALLCDFTLETLGFLGVLGVLGKVPERFGIFLSFDFILSL